MTPFLTGEWNAHHAGKFCKRDRFWLPFGLSVVDRVPLFDFHNDPTNPITWNDASGVRWRPGRTFTKFDFGSVPFLLQGIVSPICAPSAFAFHDSGYTFRAMWRVNPDWTETPVAMEREQVDQFLFDIMLFETQSRYLANKAWIAVHAAGGLVWNSHTAEPLPGNDARVSSVNLKIIDSTGALQ